MDTPLRQKLIGIAKERISSEDPSHDFEHSYRVLLNAEKISKIEGGDLEVITPACLFHDLIVYPKHSKADLNFQSQEDSAKATEKILNSIKEYPKEKIAKVLVSIRQCSFSRGIIPELLESKILQDADKLESTGVISIMRTFSSGGQMKRLLYNPEDPFCEKREPNSKKYSLDLFYNRLLIAKDRMHTQIAKKIAKERNKALVLFLKELKDEIND